MTFLPIVERELRAAARKPSTYRARTAFVLVTSLMAAGLLLLGDLASASPALFTVLATLAFLYCLVAGARQAADSLSEEKREGTLGLLFLTDLRGYDVVLGKLVAVSARTLQGLFAFLPVLSISLIMGGITGGEFWRAAGVLINTLFLSLSLGLWVSSISREAHRALAATLGLLFLITAAPLGAGWLLAKVLPAGAEFVSLVSPAAAAAAASDMAYRVNPGQYWSALLVSHLLGWCCLLFASLALPHSWQERSVSATGAEPARRELPPRRAQGKSRAHVRTQRLDQNPIYWLAARHERQHLLLWGFIGAATVAGLVVLLLSRWLGGTTFGIFTVLNFSVVLVLKLCVAWQASATLAEARQTGAVELLLATPLKVDEILRGHWLALQRVFLWPLVAALILSVLPALDLFFREASSGNVFLFPLPAMTLFGMATLVLDLVALAWVGMWMGASQTKGMQAFAKTVLFVIIIPAVVFCLPNILFDLFWISWARRKLEHEFRRAAAGRYTPPAEWLQPPAPPLVLPPVIAR